MHEREDMIYVFNAFHDGCIEDVVEKPGQLILKISCQYLAALIDKSFEYFYLHLKDISKLQLVCWTEKQKILATVNEIFDPELEILTAKQEGKDILISCAVYDHSHGYSGGDLILNCAETVLYDHNKQTLSIQVLKAICRQYWAAFGPK